MERCFTNVCVVLALFIFSSVVSRLTSSIVALQQMTQDSSKQFWLLRKYLKQRNVPRHLAARIQRFLEFSFEQRAQFIPESSVLMLKILTHQLQIELQYAVTESLLSMHLYFRRLGHVSEFAMHQLCEESLMRTDLAMEDPLFFGGEHGTKMYFVVSGDLEYDMPELSDYLEDTVLIMPQEYIAESALWCKWFYLGNAQCRTEGQILSVDVKCFCVVMEKHPALWEKTSAFANEFVQALNNAHDYEISDILDFNTLGLKRQLNAYFSLQYEEGMWESEEQPTPEALRLSGLDHLASRSSAVSSGSIGVAGSPGARIAQSRASQEGEWMPVLPFSSRSSKGGRNSTTSTRASRKVVAPPAQDANTKVSTFRGASGSSSPVAAHPSKVAATNSLHEEDC